MKVAILKDVMEEPSVHSEMRKKLYELAFEFREEGAVVEEISMLTHSSGRDIWMEFSDLVEIGRAHV